MAKRLSNALSPYLKKAADQPVDWYEWGEEAFSEAKKQDKPILLSVGGVWCHWCHVMAHESFENEEIAAYINAHFIPVKVDRDERPDIDRRYQDVVLRIAGSGGWPLTVFLTPEGKAFFGGTYFPPDDSWQRAGFTTIMKKLVELYQQDKWRVTTVAEELFKGTLATSSVTSQGDLPEELLRGTPSFLLSSLDREHGGFGSAPKFYHACAYEFLMNHVLVSGDEPLRQAVETSLDAMAKGGVYDHLLGGFFRYSTDAEWLVPHFEKMLYDNAELLRVYSIASSIYGKDLYRSVCDGIIRYYRDFGTDEAGGFHASQDADIGTLDEGGFYTFSADEINSILRPDESKVISLYFGIKATGPLHHDPSKNVLHLAKEPAEIAQELGAPLAEVRKLIASGRHKLLDYRSGSREAPFIDRTVYTNYNGLMIEALCVAGNLLADRRCIDMAERAARHILSTYWHDGRLLHRQGLDGFSEDYLFLAKGLLRLFESTQNDTYRSVAVELVDKALELFWDSADWGFFDARPEGQGYLSIPVKNIQDTPVESANGIAPSLLLLLTSLTGDTKYREYAEQTLRAFSTLLSEYPMASHSYFLSLQAYVRGIRTVETTQYFEEALRAYGPHRFVIMKEVSGVVVCTKETCRTYPSFAAAQGDQV